MLLRVLIGAVAIIQGTAYFASGVLPTSLTWMIGLPTILSGAFLLAGFLTPFFCSVFALDVIATAFSWLPPPTPNHYEGMLLAVCLAVVAAAVGLLGPGALSVDARLFGMREIVISRMKPDL